MKMTKFEKRFVNRRKKAERNIAKIHAILEKINLENINEVLEIGCGIGLVSAHLAKEYGFYVYGTDVDPYEIKLAKEFNVENHNLHYQNEDATDLSFKDYSFDLVISQNVFHHIPNWYEAVNEIQRVLRPGGYLIWYDLILPQLLKKMFKSITKNYGLYTAKDIQSKFYKAGFKIVEKQKIIHGPFMYYEIVLNRSEPGRD
jgi:ubiquinone/menaquinone biosynthesis C-methylase UbiE